MKRNLLLATALLAAVPSSFAIDFNLKDVAALAKEAAARGPNLLSGGAYEGELAFEPSSVPCALPQKSYQSMYVGTIGEFEWKQGLNQIKKSDGFFDLKAVQSDGEHFCQVELQPRQCLAMLVDDDWKKQFGNTSGEFTCINLRTGDTIPRNEVALNDKVDGNLAKLRCPHSTPLSECVNESNSMRGHKFSQELKAAKADIQSVCAYGISDPRYFNAGAPGDPAMCALTNKNGEALYKVVFQLERQPSTPLKKL